MKFHADIGVLIPEVQLPKPGTDLGKWAVIACDQFTSEPEYWGRVEDLVGEAPSTLNLIFPELYLEAPGKAARIRKIKSTMRTYLEAGLLQSLEGLVYVERDVRGAQRKGLLLGLDLERYDYTPGSSSLIRATEGTIMDRLPPRMQIRAGAALELPHILVLIDDPERTVIEPIEAEKAALRKLYDFELMFDSGHLRGFALNPALEQRSLAALRQLAQPEAFGARYGLGTDTPVLLFAVGDGNHSLATAKAVWEQVRPQVGMEHPARFALVEIVNLHDQGLLFEPIHRVLFNARVDVMAALRQQFGAGFSYTSAASAPELLNRVDSSAGSRRAIGLVGGGVPPQFGLIEISEPRTDLAVSTLQRFLDAFMQAGGAGQLDYVHGGEVVVRLGSEPGNTAFYLPGMSKSALFKTVILEGALPRKTFSLGEARAKRFYLEARKIA